MWSMVEGLTSTYRLPMTLIVGDGKLEEFSDSDETIGLQPPFCGLHGALARFPVAKACTTGNLPGENRRRW